MSTLAPYASDPLRTRGRRHAEPSAPTRTEYQRDRDRIVHSTAFRRLVYKTQVFLNHEGDLFRTRLTHSLEVAQLARSIARTMRLNEDLVEAIALAHDLGHTPFGHAGQDALNECMAPFGGFEHNLQSLRVVDALEERYPSFDGLNLCFETREGILKHCSRRNAEELEQEEPGGVAHRFIVGGQPSLEAQLCNLADEIAYNAHDIDDGVRSGLISLQQLSQVPLFEQFREVAITEYPQLRQPDQARRMLYETIRRMLSAQVYDVIAATRDALQEARPADANHVRHIAPMMRFTTDMKAQSTELKRFLFQNLYRHERVVDTTARAKTVIAELFRVFMADDQLLPSSYAQRREACADGTALARLVADYIAGMTDRFAAKEHQRLTGLSLL